MKQGVIRKEWFYSGGDVKTKQDAWEGNYAFFWF